MVSDSALAVLFVGFVGSGLVCFFALRIAETLQLATPPNERSSHTRATPNIGGLGIVVPVLVYLGSVAPVFPSLWALFGALTLLALVGLVDDLRDVGRRWRLLMQLLAASLCLLAFAPGLAGWLWPLLLLALLWHVNLYNFMDGIDGLAGAQALAYVLAALWIAPDMMAWLGYLLCVLAGALIGFLVYNWPPARMFMGDSGSTVLGLLLAAVALLLAQTGHLALPASLILLSAFWVDATYTLLVRISTGQPFASPHRSHLYQRLTDRFGHRAVTLMFCAYAFFWLFPLALYAQTLKLPFSLLPLAFAAVPLVWGARRLRAGLPDHKDGGLQS
ncbi:MAG: glycosyl transferase [Pseudomonadota bacterium]